MFLSRQQRSLYNVDRLTGRPWWTAEQTTYDDFLARLGSHWTTIRDEALQALRCRRFSSLFLGFNVFFTVFISRCLN